MNSRKPFWGENITILWSKLISWAIWFYEFCGRSKFAKLNCSEIVNSALTTMESNQFSWNQAATELAIISNSQKKNLGDWDWSKSTHKMIQGWIQEFSVGRRITSLIKNNDHNMLVTNIFLLVKNIMRIVTTIPLIADARTTIIHIRS